MMRIPYYDASIWLQQLYKLVYTCLATVGARMRISKAHSKVVEKDDAVAMQNSLDGLAVSAAAA